MTPARKAFRLVFLIFLALGLIGWLLKLVAPDAVNITWNGQPATGLTALLVALGVSAFFGLILALVVAGVVKLVTRTPAKG